MPEFRSIQGEQLDERDAAVFMAPEDVDEYVSKVDDAIIECRERGRHLYPAARKVGLRFVGVTAEGLMIRRSMCECCGLVGRVELWDVRHHRGKVTRCELVSAHPEYHTQRLADGTVRRYAAPAGRGRITPKLMRNAVGTGLLAGESFTRLLKDAKKAQKERDLAG